MTAELKTTAYRLLRGLRVFDIVRTARVSPCLLMYHRFGNGTRRRGLSIESFVRQLDHLRKSHHVLTVGSFARRLEDGTVPQDAVVITIDDCYEELYSEVFPLLKARALPATVYAVSEFVSGAIWLWPDKIRVVFDRTLHRDWSFSNGGEPKVYRLDTEVGQLSAWSDFADQCLEVPPGMRDDMIASLARDLAVELPDSPPPGFRPVTWDQLREMRAAGIEVGSHTCTHPRLTLVDALALRRELVESRRELEDGLQAAVTAFSYPHGGPADIDDGVVDGVRSAGYTSAVLSYFEGVSGVDRYRLPRYSMGENFELFLATVSGFEKLRNEGLGTRRRVG